MEKKWKNISPEIAVVTWGRGPFVVVITGEGVGLPDAEQSSAPSIVTFSTLGKVENSNVRLTFNLFSADCWALNSLFSKEQMFPEHCTFETSPDVKLVTGEENVISIFQDETGFGNVTWSVPVATVSLLLVLLKVDSQEPETPLEPVNEWMFEIFNCHYDLLSLLC